MGKKMINDEDRELDYGYAEDLDEDGNELENPNEAYDDVDLLLRL